MKPLKKDWVFLVCMILIISSVGYVIYYFTLEKVNECTSDPIRFGVEKIRENYDAEKVYGSITFIKDFKHYSWDFGDDYIDLNNSNYSG